MASSVTVTREIDTLADLREAIAEADILGIAADTPVHVKTRMSWNAAGPRLREVTITGTRDA